MRFINGSQRRDHVSGDSREHRGIQQGLSVRPPKTERSIHLSRESIPILVDRTMMAPAQDHQIRECGRTAVRPVLDVMPLADGYMASGEPAVSIPMPECPPESSGNRACPRSDLRGSPVGIVPHYYAVGVTGESLRRFSWNVRTILDDRLAGLIGVVQHRGMDV